MKCFRILTLFLLGLLVLSCAGPDRVSRLTYPNLDPPPPGPVIEESYRLGLGDSLAIKFILNPELNTDVAIRPDGKIVLPLIGDIVANGLTVAELNQTLSTKYKNLVNKTHFGEVLKAGIILIFASSIIPNSTSV